MARWSWSLRIAGRLAVTALVLLVVLFTFVQVQQHLLRRRMERLLGDIQNIRLHQTSWMEAQQLMERWRGYGRAEGPCSGADCVYQITVLDNWTRWVLRLSQTGVFSIETLNRMRVFRIPEVMGYRYGELGFRFLVHDNTIQQTSTKLMLGVPTGAYTKYTGFYESALIFTARSFPSLQEDLFGLDDQLATHPYYIVSRPGGCSFCLKADISYSSEIPQAELRRLTAFKLSCLTSFHPCKWLEDVLPIAQDWHLYSFPWAPARNEVENTLFRKGRCNVPTWVLGRDTYNAWVVDVLSSKPTEAEEGSAFERYEVRLVSTLREDPRWKSGNKLTVRLDVTSEMDSPATTHHMSPGSRYIILSRFPDADSNLIDIRHCGVLKDDPAVAQALRDGFAKQDAYRGPF